MGTTNIADVALPAGPAPERQPVLDRAPSERPLAAGPLTDRLHRRVEYLRVSVTDRCNLRCTYCLPEEGVAVAPRADVLTFEDIVRLVRCFARLGVRRLR